MDPVRNPYAPGAGQQPPELAGREHELGLLRVQLERALLGRPARSMVLVGLRGVGKTVLLQAMRSEAIRADWGTGRIEARPGSPLGPAIADALHGAAREIGQRARPARLLAFLAVLRAFSLTLHPDGGWQLGVDVEPARGRADSGQLDRDLTELLTDAADTAAGAGTGIALFLDEMQDLTEAELIALCCAVHELGQTSRPLLLVGAGLPPLPVLLAAARSYAERLFLYLEIDRLSPAAADAALVLPAQRENVDFEPDALAALAELADGYPYFIQAYGAACWDTAPASPISAADVTLARPVADRHLDLGFFGARYRRATRAERAYLHAMALHGDGPVSTLAVAHTLGRPLSSLSAVRDELLRKGLIYSPERGQIAFTVPHFARFVRARHTTAELLPTEPAEGLRQSDNRPDPVIRWAMTHASAARAPGAAGGGADGSRAEMGRGAGLGVAPVHDPGQAGRAGDPAQGRAAHLDQRS